MNIQQKITELKKQKNALIIAHFYQEPEIQDISDYVGDSLGMALYAKNTDCDMTVVCGVKFMAETFKIMNPKKKILMPDANAGCSLADSCTPQVFAYFKSKHPNAFVMTYVNSSVEIKAMSDVICTSTNAVKITSQIPADRPLLFAPDQHLGRYLAKAANRDMILFPGNCFVHASFSAKEMFLIKQKHPRAKIIAHPECEEVVLESADYIGSTSQLLEYTQKSDATQFIVMTEAGMIHQMKKASPHKEFIPGPDLSGCGCNVCPHMKLNTLQKIHDCLVNESPEVAVDPELAKRALVPINRMVEMTVD